MANYKLSYDFPLKQQLMVLVTFIALIAIIFFAYINSDIQKQLVYKEFERSAITQIEAVRLGLEIGLQEENFESISKVFNWATTNQIIDFIVIYDEFEEILAAYPDDFNSQLETLNSLPTRVSSNEDLFVKNLPWFSNISGDGEIYIGFKTKYIQEADKETFWNLFLITLIIGIATALSAFLVAKNITRPIEALKNIAQQFTIEHPEMRANELQGSYEIKVLAKSFNTMLDTLVETQHQRIQEMENFNQSLSERNNRLSSAYNKLEKQSNQLETEKEKATQALDDLKQTQVKLVQSEKMAALGQLVASVAHEINTPSGAINSAIDEINRDSVDILNDLIIVVDSLPDSKKITFLNASKQIIGMERTMSTSEIRKNAREIQKIPEMQNLMDTAFYSRLLAQVGFRKESVLEVTSLLTDQHAPLVINSFHNLGMSQIHIRDIRIAISRIIQLIKALKTYSRVDNETETYTNIQEDLENTLIILHNKTKRAITIEKEFEYLPMVKCYPGRLSQVWTNLIHNSIQAMNGSGVITIRLKNLKNEFMAVEIEDNGPGIADDVLPNIFEPYFTTNAKGEGTGLGLSISKEIVESHNGLIDVKTSTDGTCFIVTIPIIKPDQTSDNNIIKKRDSENTGKTEETSDE